MGTTLNVKLSQKSFKNAAKQVRLYAKSIKDKNKVFVEALLEKGITVARDNATDVSGTFGTHKMGKLVTFTKEFETSENGYSGLLIGMGQNVFSKISEGRSINSLLALEFGTAALALPPQEAFHGRGGQGTNSMTGHSGDMVWFALVETEVNGKVVKKWKKLSAITPRRPMYNAFMEMQQGILEAAKLAFATDKVIQC